MTTAKILRLLASDDSIVFAEPNYVISQETEENEADSSGEEPASGDTVPENSEPAADHADSADGDQPDNAGQEQQNDEPPADPADQADGEEDISGSEAKQGKSDAPALDATKYQWSSSEDSTFRAFGQKGNTTMNVPGWPDGSNMEHEIVVAVIDQAIDFSNPDLKDRAFTFTPEQQKLLGCDEHGFNAAWESKDGKLEVFPGNDHGTHVAGIIAASWDGKGVNGVGSDVRIMSLQIIRDTNKSSLGDALRAMDFVLRANEQGADIRITNNSWGVYQDSKALDAAVTKLGENGVLTVFAASNDGHDITKSSTS